MSLSIMTITMTDGIVSNERAYFLCQDIEINDENFVN
jgi:hypothetical protein